MADEIKRRKPKSKSSSDEAQIGDASRSINKKEYRAEKKATVGKPTLSNFKVRVATADVQSSGNIPFYSPQLSTDYFQLPRSNQELREWFRHFYNNDEIVARAIDLHCDLPLSKVTLAKPRTDDPEKSNYIWRFFTRMLDRVNFFTRLEEIAHEFWVFGNVFIFAEDDLESIDESYPVPELEDKGESDVFDDDGDSYQDLLHQDNEIDAELDELVDVEDQVEDFVTEAIEHHQLTPDQQKVKKKVEDRYNKWGFKNINYRGWKRLVVLPPEQVVLQTTDFSDEYQIGLTPTESMKRLLESRYHDPDSDRILSEVPEEILQKMNTETGLIPLDTDPYSGSHCFHLSKRKSQYEDFGTSMLQRCLRTLLYRDKLRQSQTMIADRAMTPKHLVWAESLSDFQVDELREQVDLALVDPDYSIVTNYQINWDIIGNSDRLLDLSNEYQEAENRLLMGLGVTKEVLTGEGTYGGNRITLEIMNTQYMLFREKLQTWVEEYLFKPIALKKGFIEIDPIDGEVTPIIPRLKFTRLAIRDNSDTYEQLFSLYQKGSIPIDYILEIFNIDAYDAKVKLEQDLFTVNDSKFNELLSGVYSGLADDIVTNTNVKDVVRSSLNLNEVEQPAEEDEGPGRFGSEKLASSKNGTTEENSPVDQEDKNTPKYSENDLIKLFRQLGLRKKSESGEPEESEK